MTPSSAHTLLLVVEDDLGLAELIREEAASRGWDFLHAPTGRDALALLASRRPDLVLLDFSLPDMTAREILDRAEMPPFIVTTGAGDERIAVEMMKQGALDYLVKDAHFLRALPAAVDRALRSVDVERKLLDAQARLKAADEQLRQSRKMESLGRMAGGIAHDFNNLFQAIQGNLESAHLEGRTPAESRAAVERALKVLEKATDLAHQMLNVSGRGFRRSETLDLNRMVREFLDALPVHAGGPDISFEEGPALPPVDGDPHQLRQVLAGLLANAREALGAGGTTPILVTTRRLGYEEGDSRSGLWIHPPPLTPELVCLCVEDAGPGMAKEVLDNAFDPFFSTHRPGRGLGLSAALGILKGHGAGLWIRTAPGSGTSVRILFPPAEAPLLDSEALQAPKGGGKRALLLVDDDEDLQETLGEFLRDNLGYEVFQARDGLEAVEVYRREKDRIGLILMDATMPRMTGPDAFKAIRELDPGAKAVLCSGFAEGALSKVAKEFGFLEFLKKPFPLRTLQENIARVMGKP